MIGVNHLHRSRHLRRDQFVVRLVEGRRSPNTKHAKDDDKEEPYLSMSEIQGCHH